MKPSITALAALALVIGIGSASANAPAEGSALKSCDALKAEIAAKIVANGVAAYALEIVPINAPSAGRDVVGHCEGGTKIIVYQRR